MQTQDAVIERKNTYEDYFRICVVSNDQEWSENRAKWITGNENSTNSDYSTYKTKFKENVTLVTYARSQENSSYKYATVALDALAIFVENEVEWNLIKKIVTHDNKNVPVRIIISDNKNSSKWLNEVNGQEVLPGTVNVEKFKNKLDSWDAMEFYRIKDALIKYDTDKSGYLEKSEFKKIALDLGESLENLTQALSALDANNDQRMDLYEFINWWKIGRFNNGALVKIFQFGEYSSNLVKSYVDVNKIHADKEWKDYEARKLNNTQPNKVHFSLKTNDTELENIKTRIAFRLVAGNGKVKDEACKNFLSKLTNIHDSKEENWLDICVFVKSLTQKGLDMQHFLEDFRSKLIDYAERNMVSGLSNFIRDFVVFKFFPQDNSAAIIFKMKDDVYPLIKNALYELISLKDFITDNNKTSFDFSVKINSTECLNTHIQNGTVSDFLSQSEVCVNGQVLKNRMRAILMNLLPKYQKWLNVLQFFFCPTGLKFNFRGPITDLLFNETLKDILTHDLSFVKPFIQFLKSNFDPKLLVDMSRFEIGFNLYDIFVNFQLFSESLWN
jgi:hypothetical protein